MVTTVTTGTFANVEQLRAFLDSYGIDTSVWGQGKAKRVDQLYSEVEQKVITCRGKIIILRPPKFSISQRATRAPRTRHLSCVCALPPQESTLQVIGGKVYRCLTVCKVVVRQPGRMSRYLACFQQTMDDGRVRERNVLPSEKLFAGEVASKAVERCLAEELGSLIKPADVDVLEDSLVVRHTCRRRRRPRQASPRPYRRRTSPTRFPHGRQHCVCVSRAAARRSGSKSSTLPPSPG